MCEAPGISFASKPELAATTLRAFQPLPGTQTWLVTDSRCPSHDFLSFCIERDFHFISAVKSDRMFNSADHTLQVKQWARFLPKRALDLVSVNTTSYKVWSATGRLSSERSITPGDSQSQHQSLSRRAEIAWVFVMAQPCFDLATVYRRLAA